MKSVSLLTFTPGRAPGGGGDSLTEVARHFETCWATAVAKVEDDTYLQADAEGNLVVLVHDRNGFSQEDRRMLRVTSECLLGESVNRIRTIPTAANLQTSASAPVVPRAFLATVDGGVYLFGLIREQGGMQDLLIRLQTEMANLVKSPGGVPFAKFRGFRSQVRDMGEEGPQRFVDGEVVEHFLELADEVQASVAKSLGRDVEELRGLVVGLRRIH
jgi:DNA damage-binding protein 1